MNIKIRVTLCMSIIAIFSTLVTSIILGKISSQISTKELRTVAKKQLLTVRDTKKTQIEDYFKSIRSQLLTLSESTMVINAMEGFSNTFTQLPDGKSGQWKRELLSYYKDHFEKKYRTLNADKTFNSIRLLNSISPQAHYWQWQYIQNNPNPIGSKHLLIQADAPTAYNKLHSIYHPIFASYLEKFGYYDIFLVDAKTDHIVYSVFKELDYATSLKNGPYANSGVAVAYKKALELEHTESVLIDFDPYQPSYENQASFIASSIVGKNGSVIGVLIFQMPIDRINSIMTYGQKWVDSGLGTSGETYLVGQDYKARSLSRFLIENKVDYLRLLENLGIERQLITMIDMKNSNIGIQTIRTQGTQAVLLGKRGFDIFHDYRNIPVLSAYTPIDIEGLNWALMSEIDEEEAFLGAKKLDKNILLIAIVTFVVVTFVSVLIGFYLSRGLSKPIIHLSKLMGKAESNNDFTLRSELNSNDELGTMADILNSMFDKYSILLHEVSNATNLVVKSFKKLNTKSIENAKNSDTQCLKIEQIASAMCEMSSTVQDIAENTSEAATTAKTATNQAEEGKGIVQEVTGATQSLSESVGQALIVAQTLASEGESISTITDVIKNIAEQTNLLALNAAIEAARAGDQGRGFAVVADEVRNLAQKTQKSTLEIEETMERLRNGTTNVVRAMEKSQNNAFHTVNLALTASQSLDFIVKSSIGLSVFNDQIENASVQQSITAEEMNKVLVNISNIANQATVSAKESASSSRKLVGVVDSLKELMSQFKT